MTFSFVCFLQYASELRFDGFSLRSLGSSLSQTAYTRTDHKLQSEVRPELLTPNHFLVITHVHMWRFWHHVHAAQYITVVMSECLFDFCLVVFICHSNNIFSQQGCQISFKMSFWTPNYLKCFIRVGDVTKQLTCSLHVITFTPISVFSKQYAFKFQKHRYSSYSVWMSCSPVPVIVTWCADVQYVLLCAGAC